MHQASPRKILYGVHGYGRGHAARAQAVLPELVRRYDVLVLAGDDAYDQLQPTYRVVRIPTIRYHHRKRGRRSARLTLKRNTPAMGDLLLGGPVLQMVSDEISRFAPDVVLSDSEPWTHRAARALGVPRIGFDHFGIMAWCRLEMPLRWRFICRAESRLYRALMCDPERVIVTAFYSGRPRRPGVRVVGPILRELVRQTQPSEGGHLLAYFSNASVNFTPAVEAALRGLNCPVKVYARLDRDPERTTPDGNLEFCPTANEPFVRDLAACRAVFATAGNQLISEAIHFGKPMLLMPEESLEQRLNARFVDDWQIGMQTRPKKVTADVLNGFLARRDELAACIPAHRRDGLAEALAAIDEGVEDLAR